LQEEESQNKWITNAFASIENKYEEIKSVIYFNSKVDNNWPDGLQRNGYLDWTIAQNQLIKNSFSSKVVPDYVFSALPNLKNPDSLISFFTGEILENIRGIYFQKSNDWRKDYHVLNRRNLETEFEKIKRIGLNTIKFEGNSIYSYNLLNVADEFGFNIAFGFWIPSYLDFFNDSLEARQLKSDILKRLNRHKKYDQITSWNIQNDVLYNQKDFFLKPRLLYQNRAYVNWLQDLVIKMKEIDSERPIYIDLEVNRLSLYHSRMLVDHVKGFDGLGLVVKEVEYLDSLTAQLNRKRMKYHFSGIDVDTLLQTAIFDESPSFFITSWRDQHESNNLTFYGITDRKGRPKWDYFKLMNLFQDTVIQIDNSKFRILRPTNPVYANNTLEYYAVIYNEQMGWKYGMQVDGYSFEWSLVKCDKYGNYLAVKDVGKGPVLSLKIPENHEYFRLLLTASDGKAICTDIATLNTPYIIN
jgi:hypothetical protein